MKKIFLIITLAIAFTYSQAQNWPNVAGRWNYQWLRGDSALFMPSGNGAPSGTASLRGAKYKGQASFYSDTAAKKLYMFNPKDSTWTDVTAGGNGITVLTGDVVAVGPGSAGATISNNAINTVKINNGAVTIPKLNATGTPDNTTFLRGDGSWSIPIGGGSTDTTILKGVFLPLFVNGPKTINQAGNNITITGGGKLKADSISLKKTLHPYMSADSALANGHSIMFGSAANPIDSSFAVISARSHGLFLSNIAVSGSIIYNAIKLQMQWINPGHNSYEMIMAAVNDVRTTNILLAANRPTINHIINSVKSMWMNHMSKVVVATGSGGVTRSGSWTTSWNAANESGKSTNGAYTTTAGNYIEYTFTDSTVGFQLMGLNAVGSTTITVAIDGSTVETFSANQQHDNSGGSYAPMCKFYTGLSVASHTIRVTNTSGGFMVMDYFTNLRDAATAPPICIFHEPHLNASRSPSDFASNAAIDTINIKYDSLRNALPVAYRVRTLVARTNNRYDATTGDISGDFIHPSNQGHRKIALTEKDAFSAAIGADSGTVQYGDDGFIYVDAKKIPYSTTLGLGDVINNNSVINTPVYVTGKSININTFKSDTANVYINGALIVRGASAGLYVLSRTGDTTKGVLYYSSGPHTFMYDLYNNRTIYHVDTSLRIAFYNNTVTSSFGNPSATIHIGGNTNGISGHAPLKIGRSLWMVTPEAYSVEPDSLYVGWTNGAGLRDTLATRGWARANLTPFSNSDQTLTSGTTVTISNGVTRLFVDPASALANLSITFPSAPYDGQVIKIFFGGTIQSSASDVVTGGISSWSTPGSLVPVLPVSSTPIKAGTVLVFEYRAGITTWYQTK